MTEGESVRDRLRARARPFSSGTTSAAHAVVAVRVQDKFYGIDLRHVLGVMRECPLTPIADAPGPLLGLAEGRGSPVRVLDLEALLSGSDPRGDPGNWVLVVGTHAEPLGLAADEVMGIVDAAAGTEEMALLDFEEITRRLTALEDRPIQSGLPTETEKTA